MMGELREVTGNLLDRRNGLVAIGQGVNLRGVMGAGLAGQIRRLCPDIYLPYRTACRDGSLRLGGYHVYETPGGRLIYNLASQFEPGPDARLDAIGQSVTAALADCAARGIDRLGLPRIGSGIGRLDWRLVRRELARAAATSEVVLEVYAL